MAWLTALAIVLQETEFPGLDIVQFDRALETKVGNGRVLFGVEIQPQSARETLGQANRISTLDLADHASLERQHGRFDIIVAHSTFDRMKHVQDGFRSVLDLLCEGGILMFDTLSPAILANGGRVPAGCDRLVYPSEKGLHLLLEDGLGGQLFGADIASTSTAAFYVGIAYRGADRRVAIEALVSRLFLGAAPPNSEADASAVLYQDLARAGIVTDAHVDAMPAVPPALSGSAVLYRLAALWRRDRGRLSVVQVGAEQAEARARRLAAELRVAASDRARSHGELANALAALQQRVGVAEAGLAAADREKLALDHQRAALEREQAQLLATQQAVDAAKAIADQEAARLNALAGTVARVSRLVHGATLRHPWLARQAVRSIRLFLWTLRGELPDRIRARWHARGRGKIARAGFPSHLLKPTPMPSTVAPASMEWRLAQGDTSTGAPAFALPIGVDSSVAAASEQPDDAPLVSVVVTSFNYGRYLQAAVDSILVQSFKNLEVIVVEGGSSDPMSRLAAANLNHPRTRVLMQGAAHRVGANRNLGISQARGRYICCLDADDTLAPTYIEKAVFLLERHRYDVVSSALLLVGEQAGQVDILEKPDLTALLAGNHVLTSAVFRRSFWAASGGYQDQRNAAPGHVHEDWAFWIRLAALGARFRNLARDPMLRYRTHVGSLSRGADVLPMDDQRKMVRQMNEDVLRPEGQVRARSRALASREYGTPVALPAPIILDLDPTDRAVPTVLLALPYLVLGGAERLLSGIVGFLVQQGWRVVIVTSISPSPEQGDTSAWFERHTTEIFNLPQCLPPEMWEEFLHHLVTSRDINILWIAGSAFSYDCLRGLRAAHPALGVVDLLFNTIGHTENNRRRRASIDVTLVENQEVLGWLSARAAQSERLLLISSGVDVKVLRPAPRCGAFIKQIGAVEGDLIVGFAGRWSDEKNPLGFIEIARLVDPRLPVKFAMMGGGPLRPAVAAAALQAGFAQGRFHLLHEVPDLAPIMASLDLLVVPSILDGRPMAVLEALALGVPVLASSVGGLPELIHPGRTGWLHAPDDLASFARTIETAARDQAEVKAMRPQAREYAEANFDMKAMHEAYQSELMRLLPEGLVHG